MVDIEDQLEGQSLLSFFVDTQTQDVRTPFLMKKLIVVFSTALRGGTPDISQEKINEIIDSMDVMDLMSFGQKSVEVSLPETDEKSSDGKDAESDADAGN